MINRRTFLRLLAAGMVAETVDVDRLLWVPGAKKIFLPEPLPISLWGIPYHMNDGMMAGTWMGISRSWNPITPEITKLINSVNAERLNRHLELLIEPRLVKKIVSSGE